jgi:hypothetical protein
VAEEFVYAWGRVARRPLITAVVTSVADGSGKAKDHRIVNGILDTGAFKICISPELADALELGPPFRFQDVRTPANKLASPGWPVVRAGVYIPIFPTLQPFVDNPIRKLVGSMRSVIVAQIKTDIIVGMEAIWDGDLTVRPRERCWDWKTPRPPPAMRAWAT